MFSTFKIEAYDHSMDFEIMLCFAKNKQELVQNMIQIRHKI